MGFLRKLLLPFALLYGAVTGIRNFLYDKGIFKSTAFEIPVIAIGNLSTGGTGKSPMVEYLIRLLSHKYKIATLSRGYKRKTSGFVLADEKGTPQSIGDEPYQFYKKFPDIKVAVDESRKRGIQNLINVSKPDIILLDDAFQHRKVKAGFYILLTAYDSLYCDDWILPAGNLRESAAGAKRADVIVVTKCPSNLSIVDQKKILQKLQPQGHQQVCFSTVAYDEEIQGNGRTISISEIQGMQKILVAGIAKPEPFLNRLKSDGDNILRYSDHHDFTESDIQNIKSAASGKPIITTEKDYVRLKGRIPDGELYYLSIKIRFLSEPIDKAVLNYLTGQNL